MQKIQKFLKFLFVLSILFVGIGNVALAEDIPANIAVTGVTINEHTVTLKVGQTSDLIATVLPADATNISVSWSSSDEGVATVTDGTIEAIAVGNATITVTTLDGSFTDTSLITVTEAPTDHLNIETDVDVQKSCSATDTDGVVHNYQSDTSYLAICAIDSALGNGSISSVELSNQFPAFGLFVTSINDVTANPDSQYWAIYKNGNFAELGLTSLPVVEGDVIVLQLHDFSDNNLGDQVTLNIRSLVPVSTGGGGNGGGGGGSGAGNVLGVTAKAKFDSEKAAKFLLIKQKEDGSWGEDMFTDWATIALMSGNYQKEFPKLIKYYVKSKPANYSLTDYERRSMALLSLGLDPYNTNGENYIEKILSSFDGKQFGDLHQDNDDIFALIVLQNAGFNMNDKIIASGIDFILSAQNENGSWDDSVDMTGASIEALSPFIQNEKTKNALEKAREFLKKNQKPDGGWGNASSTAWAMEGILALEEKIEGWTVKDEDDSINTPLDYLATLQDVDGGIKNENMQSRIWETAYALKASSGKTWNEVMQKFEKPENTGAVLGASTTIKVPEVKTTPKKTATKKVTTDNSVTGETNINPPNIPESKPKEENWFMKFLNFIF